MKIREIKELNNKEIQERMNAEIEHLDRLKLNHSISPLDNPLQIKEVRMGKGKGAPEGFVAPITPGRMLFEVEGVSYEIAKEALRLAAQKLPVTTKFVVRRDYDFTSLNA